MCFCVNGVCGILLVVNSYEYTQLICTITVQLIVDVTEINGATVDADFVN